MAGCKRRKARLRALQMAPDHSWIHAGRCSVGDPDNTVYFLCTPHGPLTIYEEYLCWVYAHTGKFRLSARLVYERPRGMSLSPKERGRVADLIDMDSKGMIKLSEGPWATYGYNLGNPDAITKPEKKDYSGCLITSPTT